MHNLIQRPYLPSSPVTRILVAGDISPAMEDGLNSIGVECIKTEPIQGLPPSLSRHTDMQMVNPAEGLMVFAPGTSPKALAALKDLGFELIQGDTPLTTAYPGDIAYNCAVVGERVFLNPKHTDRKVLEVLARTGTRIIPVKQGYAKCSVLILNEEAIITADPSIHQAALSEGMDVLLIPPQQRIVLKGYNYGFIGGTTGLLAPNRVAFFGDYALLDSWEAIAPFMKKHGLSPLALSHENPVDLGGLIPLCSV